MAKKKLVKKVKAALKKKPAPVLEVTPGPDPDLPMNKQREYR